MKLATYAAPLYSVVPSSAMLAKALRAYRQNPLEQERIQSILAMLPAGKRVLEIGARDGYITRLLAERYDSVTALDLVCPAFVIPRVHPVGGDVAHLEFPDRSFDIVVCTEVLEHIGPLEPACREIARVADFVLIGVPFHQDLRIARSRCGRCNRINPPWGHVNSFTKRRLAELFHPLRIADLRYVGEHRRVTNFLATYLQDLAGNPWGTYEQDELCVHCHQSLIPPPPMNLPQRVAAAVGARLDRLQTRFSRPSPEWIHVLFTHDQRSVALDSAESY